MIPLVGHVEELKRQKAIVLEEAHERARQGRLGRRLPGRHHDRGPARRRDRRRDREGGRVLLLRHQRPHADGLRPLARRRRASSCSTTRSTGSSRRTRSSRIDAGGRRASSWRSASKKGRSVQAEAEDRRLRRARRRPRVDPLLPRGRASTTCPARPTGCRSRVSPRPRPSSRRRRTTRSPEAVLRVPPVPLAGTPKDLSVVPSLARGPQLV